MAAINEDMGKLAGTESVSLSPDLMEQNSKGQDLQKAAKALMSELEELLGILMEGQSGITTTPVTNTKGVNVSVPKKAEIEHLIQILKGISHGKIPTSKLYEILAQIVSVLGTESKGVKEIIGIGQKALEGTPEKADADKYMEIAQKYSSMLEEGFNSGEITPEELLNDDHVQAFLAGIAGDKSALGALNAKGKKSAGSAAKSPSASKNSQASKKPSITPAEQKKADYKQAIFDLAMTIQSLLSDIMNGQNEKNKLLNDSSETQGNNAKSLLATKITDMMKEIQQQADAGKKPWYMYLIAAVLAVAGAVLSFFTAGVAGAVVAILIGAIMASPLGSMLTDALVKAIAGPNPTEAQKTGATVAAVAIITVITVILSCGASGFSGAAEGVGEGIMDGVADGATDGLGAAASKVVEEGASEAAEEATEEISQQAAKKGITYSMKALTKGLAARACGGFVQGFVGGGGVTDAIEAIMLSFPKSKKWLESKEGAIIMGIIAAVVAIIGSLVGGDMASDGVEERSDFLKESGMKDTSVNIPKGVKLAAEITQVIGGLAQGGAEIGKYFQMKNLSELQNEIGSITAQSSIADTNVQTLQGMEKHVSESSSQQEKTLQNALSGLLDSMDVEGKNQEAAMTS